MKTGTGFSSFWKNIAIKYFKKGLKVAKVSNLAHFK
jgi:hypothetical protein